MHRLGLLWYFGDPLEVLWRKPGCDRHDPDPSRTTLSDDGSALPARFDPVRSRWLAVRPRDSENRMPDPI